MSKNTSRLLEVRTARGLTRTYVASCLDQQHDWLRRREDGTVSPSVDDLRRLATVYGVSINDLVAPSIAETLPPMEAS